MLNYFKNTFYIYHLLQSTETDWNRDGKLDYIDMKIEVPLNDQEIIYGLNLYLLFDVRIYVRFFLFSTTKMEKLQKCGLKRNRRNAILAYYYGISKLHKTGFLVDVYSHSQFLSLLKNR